MTIMAYLTYHVRVEVALAKKVVEMDARSLQKMDWLVVRAVVRDARKVARMLVRMVISNILFLDFLKWIVIC